MVATEMARHSLLPAVQHHPPGSFVGCLEGLREASAYLLSSPISGWEEWAIERATGPRVCLIVPSSTRLFGARAYFLVRERSLVAFRSRKNAGAKSSGSSNARVCRKSTRSWAAASGRRWWSSFVIGTG